MITSPDGVTVACASIKWVEGKPSSSPKIVNLLRVLSIMTSPLPTSRCIDCGLHKICFPPSFEPAALEQLGNLINAQKVLNKGESIYRQGDSASAIYAVRSGALKTVMTQADGSTQVTGFYLPGEVIGLDNLAQSHCASAAIATEKTGLCELPVNAMSKLSQQLPELQSHLFQIMSTEIRADYQRMHMLSQTSAEERLVSFLLSWSARQTPDGCRRARRS